jgi:hypothetical protein
MVEMGNSNLTRVVENKSNEVIETNENEYQNTKEDEDIDKEPSDNFEAGTESMTDLREREKQANQMMMNKIKSLSRARTFRHVENALTKSTLHRLGAIYESDSWLLRIILGLCFLACMSYCIDQIITTILAYALYGSLTSSSVYYEIPAEFPGNIYNSSF